MSHYFPAFSIPACFIVISDTALTQEWTKAQKGVSLIVLDIWYNWKSDDIRAFGRNETKNLTVAPQSLPVTASASCSEAR